MDKEFLDAINFILNSNFNDDFLYDKLEEGGLGLLMPGRFFTMMNNVMTEDTV